MMNRILPIVLILIAAGIGYVYIYPTWTGDISTAQQQISNYDSALAAAATFSKKENQLISERNAISPNDLARLQEYMPDGVDNVQLIVDLDALAARYGVSLSNFSIQNNAAPASATNPGTASSTSTSAGAVLQSIGATNSLDLSVSATGTYDAFQSFLTAAELSLRPLDITSLSVTDSPTGVYTYAITFRIYWLP